MDTLRERLELLASEAVPLSGFLPDGTGETLMLSRITAGALDDGALDPAPGWAPVVGIPWKSWRAPEREREGIVTVIACPERRGAGSHALDTKVLLTGRSVDLYNGFDGLAAQAQQIIGRDPFSGRSFPYRGTRAVVHSERHLPKMLKRKHGPPIAVGRARRHRRPPQTKEDGRGVTKG